MRYTPYVELHAHSGFSFLDGASSPDQLAAAAASLSCEAMAITDHDGVWGAMEFAVACKPLGVRPIVGTELTVRDGGRDFHVTLLVESAVGWRNLCLLLTEAFAGSRDSPGRDLLPPFLPLASLERKAEGLVCLSGCAREGVLAGIFTVARGRPGGRESARAFALGQRLVRAFGRDGFRVELQRPMWRHDRARNRWLSALAERLGVPCVATGNVHSHDRALSNLQDALVSIRLGAPLDETGALRRGNERSHLVEPAAAARRFADYPDAVAETVRLADRLRFDLTSDHGYRYPGAEDPDADRLLAELCESRFEGRYAGTPERKEARSRLDEELRVIRKLGLSGFFRLHAEMLELARDVACEVRGPDSARAVLPPGRGRGSSVSSVVCYLTGLSHVDPVRAGLFLGRFLNEEISDAPDIDLDFPRDIRETLIPRIHEIYGHERSALVAAFPTFRVKGAVRDLGKALGLPQTEIERVATSVDGWAGERFEEDVEVAVGGKRADGPRWKALIRLVREAWGLPRHVSQHSGGMVLSTRPLCELCPIVPAAMEGRQIVQWDKDSCADAGFLKIDLLGLGMLSAVERCVDQVARTRGERLDLSRIRLDDPEVYSAIQSAETTGVFQIESRAQMQMLPRSLPENLDDLTVQVALVRPGPIQGGAVHPYLDRKARLRQNPDYEVPYEHPSLEPILSDTLGAIVFQDQVIQVAMALAGFSAGEAEGLRRAMSRKRSDEAMAAYQARFVEGATSEGVQRETAERVFEQIRGFSGFGFPKSHAAAFGLLAYQSTWLRVHRGPEFLCALLNEQPMGFYPPDALVHEGQRRGIQVRPPDVLASEVECMVHPEDLSVRIGLGYVSGLREADAAAIVAARVRGGGFASLGEMASSAGIPGDSLERLARAGACDSVEPGVAARRPALWRLGVAEGVGSNGQLALPMELPSSPQLAELDDWEVAVADYASTGMTLGAHPMALMRDEMRGMATSSELDLIADGTTLQVGGVVVARQRPATAKGIVFMLLEDETGVANIVVPAAVYTECRLAVRTASFAAVSGRLERRGKVINVVATRVSPLATPGVVEAEVRSIEPVTDVRAALNPAGALAAVAPQPQSFGRRAG